MNKKSILIASIASLGIITFSLACFGKQIFSTSIDRKVNKTPLKQAVNTIDDQNVIHSVVPVNNGLGSVNTSISNGTLDDNKNIVIPNNGYVVWTNDEDSPIRGIEQLTITFDKTPAFGQIGQPLIFASFNPLNLADALAGKYQDLCSRESSWGRIENSVDFYAEEFRNCKYFMAIILPFGDGATKITDFEITAVCADEPTREDPSIGTFPGYSAEMLAALPEEAKFPYIGNGLYEPAVYGSMVQFRTIQDSSHFQNFMMGIGSAGYNPTNVIQGTYIFQKAASGSMFYTIYMLEPQYFGNMTLLMVAYAGLQPSMAPESGWPADALASRFTDANFISVISIDPGVLPEDTTYVCMDDPEDSSEFIIQATSNLPTSYASAKALLPVVKSYISTLQSFGYMLDSSSESDVEDDERFYCSYTLFAQDIEHYIAIIITFSNGQFHFQVVFCEKAKTLLDVDEIIETYCQDIFPHTGFGARNYFAEISSSPTSNYFNLLTNEISAAEVEDYYNNVTYSNKSKVELTNYIRYTFYNYDAGYMYYEIRVYTDHVTIYFNAENIK